MMNSRPAALEIEGLSVKRGDREVLHDVSLSVDRGSLVALLGPSGCGKTTLMRSVMGVQRRVTGRVEVLGLPAGHKELRRRLAYMSQGSGVYPDLTVRQNLWYFASVLGLGDEEIERALEETDLAPQAEQLASTLSGGQWSRVSLAVALLGAPQVLVLDEPTVGLDPLLRVDLWTLFRRLADGGTTLLVSSHVMDEATRCDRLVLMRQGRVIADEAPIGLLARTGSSDAEEAFLKLIRSTEGGEEAVVA